MIDRGDSRLIGSIERNAEANEFVIRADKFENDIYFELQLIFFIYDSLRCDWEYLCEIFEIYFLFYKPSFQKTFQLLYQRILQKIPNHFMYKFIDLSIITEIEMETYEIENTK